MTTRPLHISYDEHLDGLDATPFGTVMDRQGHGRWRAVSDQFAFFLDQPSGDAIGFRVLGFSTFDSESPRVAEIFTGPRFEAPALGLRDATAGEIVLAVVPFVGGISTIDRQLFVSAIDSEGEEALGYWRACLQAGNLMAHYGAGYTLLDLGEPRLAYRHLRVYTELVPTDSWAWAYRAHAAWEMGELPEARLCCHEAIRLEEDEGEETNALELLAEIDKVQ